ncbi:UNVERIFIED_CONTAM: hypothetical protein FKN15_012461 [Acipenser sinensis]
MEEADGAGPANNEPHEEADKRGQSCSDRGDTGGFGMKIDSVAVRGLKEGPDTYGCGDRTLTNLARINITTLPVDLKPINLAALTDETGNSSSTDLNADVEKQHFLPLTNTEEQQEVMDTAAGGNKTDLKNKYPDTLWDTLHQSRKLCFKSKGLTRSFQHNASIDNLSVSPQTNCDGQHKVLNTLSEHHNSVSKTTGDADFRTSCHVLDGLDVSQASFTKKNNNTCYSCITASKLGTLSASSADMTMVNATDIIPNCEYRAEFRVGDYKENTNNVKRVGLDRVSSQESACEESQIGPTLPGAAQSTECNLSAEVIINGTKAVSLEDAISDPRTESNNSVNVEEEMVEILEDSRSLLEIFHASSGAVNDQDDLNYELQQGYRILNGFLLEKHRSLTTPFMNPVSKKDFGDYTSRIQEPMWLRRMEQKFINREYETITDFVGDFRLMLENCYRYHGVDHWLSKQAQKLEMMLEQKLTLLSREVAFQLLAIKLQGNFQKTHSESSFTLNHSNWKGKKSDSKKTTVKKRKPCLQLPFEPRFQLVCTNVEELRALIRKTEEELKEFENMRKKSGKWYFRRQAVKELHCTLVRLLNELLPWEPKLIKAFQRNRARLKKDFDDFKRHPDHDNFVREVWTGEEGDGNLGRDTSSTETNRPSDGAEKQEVLKKELKGMEDSMQQGLELPAGRNRPLRSVCQEGLKLQPKNPKRRQSSSTDDELTPKKRTKLGINEDHVAALAETPLSNLKPATEPPATETFKVLPVFTKGDKPIQALLAKNVGNKVTLISQLPVTSSQISNKVAVVPREKTLTAGQAPAKNPLQMLYKMPDNSCVPFDLLGDRGSGSVKIARQPVLDQKTGEKVLQKVVILPRNLLLHHKHLEMETKQNQPSTTPKKASPGSFFDSFGTVQLDDLSKIPVQQVAPLSEVPRTEPAGISPKPNYLGASSSKFAPGQSSAQTSSSSRAVAASVSAAETSKSSDSMQELKTVCIRDSQSILVTTRGGNTGIVKVQTNPDHSTPGSLPTSPIFTFPPGFKAFLVSKSATSSATASATTCSATTSPGSTHFAGSSISSLFQLPSIPFTRAMGNSVCQTQPQKNMGSGQVTLSKSTMSSATLATTTQALSGTLHSFINMAAGSVGAVSTESFGKTSMVVTQAPLAQYATKLLTKRTLPQSEASSADRAPIQKVILVTSPSIVTPCGSASKFSPAALAAPFHTQKLMFISPTSATATQSLIGAPKTPEKVTSMDPSTNPHAAVPTFSQIRDVKIGLNIGQAIVNAAANNLQKVQAINLVPSLAARLTEDPPSHGRQTNISAPGADAGVRTAVSSTTQNATPNDFSSSVNPGPINNRKTMSVSTVKAGHLASSVLIAASPQQCVSSVSSPVPTMGSPKAVHGRSSHLKTSPVPYTSSLPQKDVTDGNIQLLRTSVSSQAVGHPISLATLCTTSFPVCAISTPFSQSQSQVPRNVSRPTQIFNTPVPAPRAVAQSTTVNLLSESSVQQKIVINTSTPLAPGTQIVINNSRLIVPPQGLGPGSHVLLISSPGMSPTGSVTGGPLNQKAIPVSSGPVCLTGNQNPRSLPTTSAQTSYALNKSQPPSTVKLTLHSAKTHAVATASSNLVMAVGKPLTLPIGTNPLPTGNAISAAQVSHLMAAKKITAPATQQSLRERAQTVTTFAEAKGLPIAAVQAVGNFVKGPVIATAPSVASSVNSTKTALAHGTLANMITKAQLSPLTPTLQPIGVSRPQTLPTATVPPIGSTISRIQTLPVATVPPIGSAITQTQASPIGSVTPSDHPVIMAPAQPLTATTLNTIRTPVPFTNPAIMLSKQLQPASCLSLLTNSSSSKLIVSPEGAILNAISTPVPSFVKLSKPVATVVVTPSSSAGRMLPVFKVEDPSPHSGDPDKTGLT